MDGQTEQILLARIRGGNPAAFEQLVLAHTAKTVNLAFRLVGNREEAEDIAQEAFLRLHRALPTFRGESSISTWLYRTVSRLAIDHLRREKIKRKLFFFRHADDEVDPMETVPDPAASPQDQVVAAESGRRLAQALKLLSPRQRAVFTLRHQEEMTLKEIASMLELEEGTVKAHLHRAVHLLRKELKDLQRESP